jgi:hypothetical protein
MTALEQRVDELAATLAYHAKIDQEQRCSKEWAADLRELLAALTAAQAEIKRRDEVIEAVKRTANNAIYFDDSSDYGSALWEVCRDCEMCDDVIGKDFMDEPAAKLKEGV